MTKKLIITSRSFWQPTDISGLVFWIDPSDTASITSSGGAVSQVNDKSPSAAHATQSTAGNKPTTGTRTINGLNVLDVTTNDYLIVSANVMASASAGTALWVCAVDADPPATNAVSGPVLGGWGTSNVTSHEPYTDGVIYNDFGSSTRKITGNPTPALTTPRQIDTISASGAWSFNIDGSTHYSTATNTVAWTTGNKYIGVNLKGGTFGYDGRIGEILVYNSALSGQNLDNARSYLRSKWGTP